jgi:Domain of unknown function (DUF3806)
VKCTKLMILAVSILAVPLAVAQVRSPKERPTTMSDREVHGLPEPKFTELSAEDTARLEQQRAVVLAAARERYGTPALTRTRSDLPVLQRLIDERVFNKAQTYELQCLGVALGDVLASELPLRWVMVTDEFGTDPTLRFKQMTLQVNALTIISKRIDRDEQVSVQWLLDQTREQLAVNEKKFR